MNKIEIFKEVEEEIKELEIVEKVLKKALEKEKLENTSFNSTDVITFALEDENSIIIPDEERILGDIYISIDKAREQSMEYQHSLLRELSFLAVHGFYHLLGYDHQTKEEEKIMFQKQEEVLESYGIRREN